MKLKIRYENEIQTIELDAKATEEMWVSLSLEGEGLSQKEREELIQKEWNEQFNKGDYNNWHKFNRHRGYSKAVPDEETEEVDCSEPLMSEVRDSRIFCKQELEKDKQYDYEACCDRIRASVKPAQADMLIAIILEGMTVAEYAELIGDTPNNVSHRYRRAINNLKKNSKTSFCTASYGYLLGGSASNKDFGGSSHGITKRENDRVCICTTNMHWIGGRAMGIRNAEGYMDVVPYQAIANIDREMKARTGFRPLVYICAPFSGDIEANKKKAAAFAEYAYQNGCIPVTPHLLFPFMDDENKQERDLALHMDLVLMGKCQEVWVLSERITAGMSTEIEKAQKRRQVVRYFTNDFTEVECL